MRESKAWRRWHSLAPVAGVLLACGAGALADTRIELLGRAVSPLWPPSGVGLWAVLVLGWRCGPAVLLGCGLGALLRGASPGLAAWEGVAALLEVGCGALLMRRVLHFRPQLDRVQDVQALVLGALFCGLLGALSEGLAPGEREAVGWAALGTVGAAHGLSVLVLTPLLLAAPSVRRLTLRQVAEAAALVAGLGLLCAFVFGALSLEGYGLYSQVFLLFPLAIWAALRFGRLGAAFVSLLVSAAAILSTRLWLGPFADQVILEGLFVLQTFIAVFALTALTLAASSAERRAATEQSHLLATAMRSTQEGVLLVEREQEGLRIRFANEGFAQLTGYGPSELQGLSPEVVDGAVAPEARAGLLGALAEGRPFRAEWRCRRRDGVEVEAELQASPVQGSGGGQFVLAFRDSTERKRMQGQLVLAARMASVGTVAAGLAHEINNPLAFVLNNLVLATRELPWLASQDTRRAARLQEVLEQALAGTERVRLLVRNLKALSRDAADEQQALDLNALVELALSMAAHELRHRGRVVRQLGHPPKVLANEARLGQVMLNLVVNAAQALPEQRSEGNEVRVVTGRSAEGGAFVEVHDTGCGISPEVLPSIFEPFFTTKPAGVGTGLGLPICHQIVRELGGSIHVESTPGAGSVFRVELPAAPVQAPALLPLQPVAPADSEAARARILIVDDEVRLAESMRMLLSPPHAVTVATSGEHALQLLRAGEQFDLVLCDLQMPGVSGMELYQRLEAEAPGVLERFVFCSGGAFTAPAREFIARVPNLVLDKPVRPEVLLETVERFLARADAQAAPAA